MSLKKEMTEFFSQGSKAKSKEFSRKPLDDEWLLKLARLNDIFGRLNILNRSLQGPSTTIIDFVSKLKGFIMKLKLWGKKVGQGRLDIFENLSSAVTSQNMTRIQELVQEHLSSLKKEFLSYFPDLSLLDAKMIRSPFTVDASSVPDDIQDEPHRKRCL